MSVSMILIIYCMLTVNLNFLGHKTIFRNIVNKQPGNETVFRSFCTGKIKNYLKLSSKHM